MRLLIVFALTLAAFLAAADVSALNDAPSKRLLRSTVSVDEEEERGLWQTLPSSITKLLKPTAVKALDDPKIAKVTGTSLFQTFKAVNPNKFNSVDDLFSSKAFSGLEAYVYRLNQQNIDKQTSVAKVFSSGFGDKRAMQLFVDAARSSDEKVKYSGNYFRDQLLTQWAMEGMKWKKVSKIVPAKYTSYFEKKYTTLLIELAIDSQKKATRLAKLERARAVANNAV
ncbi:hypothetical protein P3T76_007982 [Phytophthora citrophthora]|uniref:RxLR effector protein n=1 Tax=Phytophthora citrophthora TaxID=4793 RepID=A0AAD9GM93_9STRA|nr:hypothetical protein P3T76_007982 [Phytophthora citrophthora]